MMARILCIDDEAPLRRILTAELRDAGHETIEASTGREGLRLLQATSPDIIVCDVGMPDMNGYEVLAELNERHPEHSNTPFIFLSALADRKNVIAGKQLGADDYLTKPIDVELLLATIEARLSRARRFGERLDIERRKVDELNRLTHFDALTGLPNRAHFLSQLEKAMAERGQAVVVLINFDRFKTIASTLGHQRADKVLQGGAGRLSALAGHHAVVGRVGDDIFAILCPSGGDLASAQDLSDTLRREMSAPFAIDGREVFLTISIGLAGHPGHGDDALALLSAADAAVHAAKRAGGNAWRAYDDSMAQKNFERLSIENELRHALARHELELHFQPKFRIDDLRPVGMEALLRWHSPVLGRVSPAVFVPVAEESGLIPAIGEYVLRDACTRMRGWLDRGFPAGTRVAVNLSVIQFQQPDLVDQVRQILAETGLPADALILEITESALVGDERDLIGAMSALRDLGLTLSIDDFGTGYSSLSYLARLPAHELKIDQSFTRGLPGTAGSRTIVEAIITIGGNLDLKLVAEGVETEEQLNYLRERKVHVGQGYWYARPMPADEFERFMMERF